MKIVPFKKVPGPDLETRLKETKKEKNLKTIMNGINTLIGFNKKEKNLKTIKNGINTLIGFGRQENDIVKAVDFLLKRDYPEIYHLDYETEIDKKLTTFIPEYFLTGNTAYLDPSIGDEVMQKISEEIEQLKGDEPKKKELEKVLMNLKSAHRAHTGEDHIY